MTRPLPPRAHDDQAARWESLMREAIREAALAQDAGDVPAGCVVFDELSAAIIGRGHNRRERDGDPTAHAEVVALRQAAMARGHWRLTDCTLVVTLEPCPMCAGAIVNARLPRVVFGAFDPKAGAAGSIVDLLREPRLNHRADVIGGVLADDCAAQLRAFFRQQRALGKK